MQSKFIFDKYKDFLYFSSNDLYFCQTNKSKGFESLKAATIIQLKKELETYTPKRLVDIVLQIAKFKVDNKELLSFILFDSDDIHGYVSDIKLEIDEAFEDIHQASFYVALKRLRKITRLMAKYVKFTKSKAVDAELTAYFCDQMVERGYLRHRYKAMVVLFSRQVARLTKILPTLEDDLQFDYRLKIEKFNEDAF